MKDRIFLDSNILIYSIDNQKSKIVETIINSDCEIFISTQVVNEFINVCFKKKLLGFNNTLEASKKFMSSFNLSQKSENTIYKAFENKDNYKYSYYDCLIISSDFRKQL
jgi:predicted nucleic acid-binding protein